MKVIAPSILSADFSNLEAAVKAVEKATNWLHIDVMDGHFVPNLTIGPAVVKSLRSKTKMFFDLHLMIEYPKNFIKQFVDAGANLISVHLEAKNPLDAIKEIKEAGIKAGIAISPPTTEERLLEYLGLVDLVLVMSVNPGFGGQKFIPETLNKVKRVKNMLKDHPGVLIEIDGGINQETARLASEAGCDIFVAGSSVYRAHENNLNISPDQAVKRLYEAVLLKTDDLK